MLRRTVMQRGMGRNAEPARRFGAPDADRGAAHRSMTSVRRLAAAVVLLCTCAPAGQTAGQPLSAPPIAELVARLQAHYDGIADFSADFEHRYAGGVLQATDVERGTIHVRKPGQWRFDYVSPEPKLFVCDGATIHSYFPADGQVVVSPLPAAAGASTPASFLAGDGDLQRDFAARYAAGQTPNAWFIELTPLGSGADYDSLGLAVDRATMDIIELSATDFQGGVSTYVFSNIKRNQGLSDTLFVFDVPGDVEVVTDDIFAR